MPDSIVLTVAPASPTFILTLTNNPAVTLQAGPLLVGGLDLTGPTSIRGFECFVSGSVGDNEALAAFISPYTFTIDLSHCSATAMEVPLTDIVFSIRKTVGNVTTQIGTVTFTGGSANGVFAFSDYNIVRSDLITISAPASADPSIANIVFLVAE